MDINRIRKWFHLPGKLLAPFLVLAMLLCGFLVGAMLLILVGTNPLNAFRELFVGAFGNMNGLTNTFIKTGPLVFVGLGICISFRAGVFNVGGEGQIVIGALSATAVALTVPNWPGWLLILLCLFVGFLAGAIWGGVAGFLKAYARVNEVLSTIMMNYIAVYAMNYLLRGPMLDRSQLAAFTYLPQTSRVPVAAYLPCLFSTRIHLGIAIGALLGILVYVFLWRTTIGFRIRMIGKNARAARGAGVNVKGYMVLSIFLAGGLAGLGGAVQVLGVHHRLFTDGSAFGFTASAGFNGIVAALFAQLHPIGTVLASFLFGGLLTGAFRMQRTLQVPTALIGTLNGLIVLFVVASQTLRSRQAQHVDRTMKAVSTPLVGKEGE